MSERPQDERLERILNEFVTEVPSPHASHVGAWMARFPEYGDEIMAFAASWAMMRVSPRSPNVITEEEVEARGLAALERLRSESGASNHGAASGGITSLMPPGSSLDDLAEHAGLSVPLWRQISLRQIANVPPDVIKDIAAAIQTSYQAVADFIRQGPPLAAPGHYRAAEQPRVSEPLDFFEEVRLDDDLTESQKARLLAMGSNTAEDGLTGGLIR